MAFGGHPTKGISFKDLFCGLVLLSHGTVEEKIRCKFIYTLSHLIMYIHIPAVEYSTLRGVKLIIFINSSLVRYYLWQSWTGMC